VLEVRGDGLDVLVNEQLAAASKPEGDEKKYE
jgi:hypothetical protein